MQASTEPGPLTGVVLAIFYMHRGYFARSLEENKEDPLGGRYGPSVLAAVRSLPWLRWIMPYRGDVALDSLLFHQPHQELTFATTADGGTDMVLPHPCLLLFCSYLLPQSVAESDADRGIFARSFSERL